MSKVTESKKATEKIAETLSKIGIDICENDTGNSVRAGRMESGETTSISMEYYVKYGKYRASKSYITIGAGYYHVDPRKNQKLSYQVDCKIDGVIPGPWIYPNEVEALSKFLQLIPYKIKADEEEHFNSIFSK